MAFFSIVIGLVLAFIIGKLIEWRLRKPFIDGITKDKYIFVTGCDSGFGNKLAKQLDAKGVHVIATCLTSKGREELNGATSDRVNVLQMDVTKHESVMEAHAEVMKILPHEKALWGVVNNAGVANVVGFLEWSRREDYERVFSVNLFGTIDVTLTFLPLLKKSDGRLLVVTSCAGRLATIAGGYCESKFALEAFSDIVRRERAKFGYHFKVSIIEPGFFATNMGSLETATNTVKMAWNRLTSEEKKEFPETILEKYIKKRLGKISSMLSPDINKVTDTMEHALFAQWPQTRYVVGWDARLLWIPLSYLPAGISDMLIP